MRWTRKITHQPDRIQRQWYLCHNHITLRSELGKCNTDFHPCIYCLYVSHASELRSISFCLQLPHCLLSLLQFHSSKTETEKRYLEKLSVMKLNTLRGINVTIIRLKSKHALGLRFSQNGQRSIPECNRCKNGTLTPEFFLISFKTLNS